MRKAFQKLADSLRSNQRILLVCAAICLVLSVALLVNQVVLNRVVREKLAETTALALPSIRWYEEETAVPSAAEITTQAALQNVSEPTPHAQAFVLNTNSKVIHTPDCRYADTLKAENRGEADASKVAGLLETGYRYCSVCCKL